MDNLDERMYVPRKAYELVVPISMQYRERTFVRRQGGLQGIDVLERPDFVRELLAIRPGQQLVEVSVELLQLVVLALASAKDGDGERMTVGPDVILLPPRPISYGQRR